jgi:anti-anti-sigma regulatory factor
MMRIQRSANGEVVFTLSGRMDDENIAQVETLIRSEVDGLGIVLDLKDLILVGREAISFLERCETDGITLKNCGRYVRELITRQRLGS